MSNHLSFTQRHGEGARVGTGTCTSSALKVGNFSKVQMSWIPWKLESSEVEIPSAGGDPKR